MSITLTPEEQTVFDAIEFDATRRDFHSIASSNASHVVKLMRMLSERKAIPPLRLRHFTDPDLFPGGRGKSHKQVFEMNGCTTALKIFQHPHFLPYLRYFVSGPQLPKSVMTRFAEIAAEPFRDLETLRKFVRTTVRDSSMRHADEEFFKLALESGLDEAEARMIRTDAMTAARTRR